MAHKPTAPAVPAAPIATPPAADTGAGTSSDAALLDQLTGDGDDDDVPPASGEPTDSAPASTDPATTAPDHEAYEDTFPGRPGFDPETASAAALEEHVRILEARKKLKALTDPEQPVAPVSTATNAPVPVTVVETPSASPAAPGPKLITKVDEHGNEQSLPQAVWDALGAANLAKFTNVAIQPEKPASLI
jgi:hypothetical protein